MRRFGAGASQNKINDDIGCNASWHRSPADLHFFPVQRPAGVESGLYTELSNYYEYLG